MRYLTFDPVSDEDLELEKNGIKKNMMNPLMKKILQSIQDLFMMKILTGGGTL